ncbi:hypothetical protein [Paraburkholderia diazotrophica]|nr:hypothetical protein [Paraburkholderia diazotrophica]
MAVKHIRMFDAAKAIERYAIEQQRSTRKHHGREFRGRVSWVLQI